jgi:hypothetical protein
VDNHFFAVNTANGIQRMAFSTILKGKNQWLAKVAGVFP